MAATRADRPVSPASGDEPKLDFGGTTPYEDYVHASVLHSLQSQATDEPLEMSFLIVTQVMELYFGLIAFELRYARDRLAEEARLARAAEMEARLGLRTVEERVRALSGRADALRQSLAQCPDWRIDSIGAYFAYMRHPFPRTTGAEIAERLAAERGILCLPGSCFGPGQDDHLRVAFANIECHALRSIPPRLAGLEIA